MKKRKNLREAEQLNVRIDRRLLSDVNKFRENELRPYEPIYKFTERSLKLRLNWLEGETEQEREIRLKMEGEDGRP